MKNEEYIRNLMCQQYNFTEDMVAEIVADRKSGMSWPRIGEKFSGKHGMTPSRRTLQRVFNKWCRNGSGKPAPREQKVPKSVVEFHGDDTCTVDKKVFLSSSKIKDRGYVLKTLGYDPSEWDIINLRVTEWDAPSGDDPDNVCYSVRCLLKPKRFVDLGVKQVLDLCSKEMEGFPECKRPPKCVVKNPSSDYLMEIPPIELHYGKRVHTSDSGCNYDAKIAERVFYHILDEIIERQKESPCGTCLLVIGSDFFNAESNGMTTGGTPQDNDGRYMKLFIDASRMYEIAIETLLNYFPKVDVMLCVGNHAKALEFNLYSVLQAYFRNVDRVSFSDCTLETQLYKWGRCGIFFNHGVEKLDKIARTLPAEFRKDWSDFDYTELHVGHLHKEGVVEEGGIIVRRVSSPCATDYWHYTRRFIGAVRAHQCFKWSKTDGLKQVDYIHVPCDYFK